MMLFKRQSLSTLEDQGILRRPRDLSMETQFIPQLYNQIVNDLLSDREKVENIDSMLNMTLRTRAKQHRQAMMSEFKRKEEKKKEEVRLSKQKEEEKR